MVFRKLHVPVIGLIMFSDVTTAGGLNAQRGAEIGPLFSEKTFGIEVGTYQIESKRKFTDVKGTNRSPSGPQAASGDASAHSNVSFSLPYYYVYANYGRSFGCMGRSYTPYYGEANPGSTWAGRHVQEKTKFDSDGLDVTCRVGFAVGTDGIFSVIGGWRKVDMELTTLSISPAYTLGVEAEADTHLKTKNSGNGWRAGVAYELPKYQARAVLLYTSPVNVDLEGSTVYSATKLTLADPKKLAVRTPRSLELNLQSGLPIAGGLLGWINVRHEDWGQDWRQLTSYSPITPPEITVLRWSDALTVEMGAAKKLTPKLSMASTFSWDKGMAQDIRHSYGLSLGGNYALTDSLSVKLNVGARYSEGAKGVSKDLRSANVVDDVPGGWSYGYGAAVNLSF